MLGICISIKYNLIYYFLIRYNIQNTLVILIVFDPKKQIYFLLFFRENKKGLVNTSPFLSQAVRLQVKSGYIKRDELFQFPL